MWTRDSYNPLVKPGFAVQPGGPPAIVLADPCVLRVNGIWHLYMTVSYEAVPGASNLGIKHGTSSDGIHWTLDAGLALEHSAPGGWDDTNIETPAVLYDAAVGVWTMLYGGGSQSDTIWGGSVAYKIGCAVSDDGVVFTRVIGAGVGAGLVLTVPQAFPGAARGAIADPTVIRENGLTTMWFTGFALDEIGNGLAAGIMRAQSADHLTWACEGPLYIVRPDGGVPQQPTVIKANGQYVMWLTCDTEAEKAGLAGGIDARGFWRGVGDGRVWQFDWAARDFAPRPELAYENRGVATGACVVLDGKRIRMYYGGHGTACLPYGWEAFGIDALYGLCRATR